MASNSTALLVPVQSADTNALVIDIKDGLVEIPASYAGFWYFLLGLLVIALIWFLWRYLKKKKKPVAPVVFISPQRKAKDRLRGAAELMSDPYRFCSLVSDVLRFYVEERFELRAPERTTEEFMEELRASSKLRNDHKLLLEDFLSRCDLVKFARMEPTEPELQGLLDSALRFIDETTPFEQGTQTQPAAEQVPTA